MPGPVRKSVYAFAHSLLAAALGVAVILTLLLYSGGSSHMRGEVTCPKSIIRQQSTGDKTEPQSVFSTVMLCYL